MKLIKIAEKAVTVGAGTIFFLVGLTIAYWWFSKIIFMGEVP